LHNAASAKFNLSSCCYGLAEPTKGKIYWRTNQLTDLELQQLAGLVFQFPERHFCGGTTANSST